jgi:hypothetical protein
MAILTQRIAFMLGGQPAMDRLLKNPNENADLARVSRETLLRSRFHSNLD